MPVKHFEIIPATATANGIVAPTTVNAVVARAAIDRIIVSVNMITIIVRGDVVIANQGIVTGPAGNRVITFLTFNRVLKNSPTM
jgi:hypothetical protein